MGRRGTSYEEGAHLRRRPVFEAHRTHETQARAQFLSKNAKNPTDFHWRGAGTGTEPPEGHICDAGRCLGHIGRTKRRREHSLC